MIVISLGAGVQSTTMALMAKHGDIGPMPDCAIFADTGNEPAAVYRHLEWLETVLPFPVHRVRRAGPSLGDFVIGLGRDGATRTAGVPFFTKDPHGMLPRQCSVEFKVRPIQRKVRELVGPGRHPKGLVEQWLGISWDEAQRMKTSSVGYIVHRFPLIELEMRRHDCQLWLERHQYRRPPKSACVFCPYHSADQWRSVRAVPEDWAQAVEFDAAVRAGHSGMAGSAFVHRQRVPLAEADLSSAEDRGQLNMFNDECEGMCGV